MIKKEILIKFSSFLEDRLGLNFKNRLGDLEKKLLAISRSFGFNDGTECLEWLLKKPLDKKQMAILTFHLTVGETYFFRDENLFAALKNHIFPTLLKKHHKDRTLRIWSAGCCTGEEPYSIAILLHHILPDLDTWNITLLGTDINSHFLQKAENARYKKWSFRATPPEIKAKYFEKQDDDSYLLTPDIRKLVTFRQHNLIEDDYPNPNTQTNEISLLLCHNVLIYFSNNEIKKTIHKFATSLTENGFLSVAPIEVPFVSEKNLVSHKFERTIFHEKKAKVQKASLEKPSSSFTDATKKTKKVSVIPPVAVQLSSLEPILERNKQLIETKVVVKESLYKKSLELFQQKKYKEVITDLYSFLKRYQKDPNKLKDYMDEVLLLINTFANQGDTEQGLEWCEDTIRADKLNPMAHYLYASLIHTQGNNIEAIKSLKRALFIDSNFIMAYYMLGMIELQEGNKKAWLQNMKIALKLLEEQRDENLLNVSDDFSIKQMKELINNNLNS